MFLYVGCILNYLALLQYHSTEEISVILSVGTSYLNIVVRDLVFTLKRNSLQELWHRLEDDDFKVKGLNELRYYNSLPKNQIYYEFVTSHPHRLLTDVKGRIRKTKISMSLFALNLVVFILTPALAHILPLLLWYPFDPYATVSRFVSVFSYEMLCSFVAVFIGAATNMYVYVVLICLCFSYELLGERAQRVGLRSATHDNRSAALKATVYSDMVELIKLQMKINK